MNKRKTPQRIKMILALLLALIIVSYGAPNIFVAGSPQIRQDFIANIRVLPQIMLAYFQHPTDSGTRENKIENLRLPNESGKEDLDYQPVGKGIYAAEDPVTKERYVKVEAGTKLEIREITLSDGQKVQVYVPVAE